ncbi:MAG: hypothetical protein RIQ93_491 [Verrucomicrobiota bacterium]
MTAGKLTETPFVPLRCAPARTIPEGEMRRPPSRRVKFPGVAFLPQDFSTLGLGVELKDFNRARNASTISSSHTFSNRFREVSA